MSVTSIVTALFIAAFFCLIIALLLVRAERDHLLDSLHPYRPAEPDTGDDEYPADVAQPERGVGVRSDPSMTAPQQHDIITRIVTLEADAKLERHIRLNHRRELNELRDLVDLLNCDAQAECSDCEAQPERSVGVRSDEDASQPEQPAAPAEPLPVIDAAAAVRRLWSGDYGLMYFAEATRLRAQFEIIEAGGRLDFLL